MAQAPGMKTTLSSGSLNPTAAEFVPGGISPVPREPAVPSGASGLSAALAAKIAAENEQLHNPSAASSAPAARPPKLSSKVGLIPFVCVKPRTHLSPNLPMVLGLLLLCQIQHWRLTSASGAPGYAEEVPGIMWQCMLQVK